MNSLGISSDYYAYAANSVYNSTQVSYISSKQDNSDAQNLPKTSSSDDINDEAIISPQAQALFEMDKNKSKDDVQGKTDQNPQSNDKQPNIGSKFDTKLSPEQQQVVAQLKARDVEVRSHEQAHIAAAAGLSTSAPSYDYQTGPDGQKYAIGGEVGISFVQSQDPQENLANAETLKAAALAPAQPSSQDLAVARNADKIIEEAREEIAQQQSEQFQSTNQPDLEIKKDKSDDNEQTAKIEKSDNNSQIKSDNEQSINAPSLSTTQVSMALDMS